MAQYARGEDQPSVNAKNNDVCGKSPIAIENNVTPGRNHMHEARRAHGRHAMSLRCLK